MARSRLSHASRLLLPRITRPSRQICQVSRQCSLAAQQSSTCSLRHNRGVQLFSTSAVRPIGITPESENAQATTGSAAAPADLTDGKYHELADHWLENALVRFEDLQDAGEDIDIEFSSGVMTIRTEAKGTYVLNKQPPNKQIWLSSPLSGPKRYDWCVIGGGKGDKEGAGVGRWIYARDQTTLDQLILEELGVDLESPLES